MSVSSPFTGMPPHTKAADSISYPPVGDADGKVIIFLNDWTYDNDRANDRVMRGEYLVSKLNGKNYELRAVDKTVKVFDRYVLPKNYLVKAIGTGAARFQD